MNTPAESARSSLVFSIDLEEFYLARGGVDENATPLLDLVSIYLGLLAARKARGTFFVVGELARKRPEVLRFIAAAGHELACHGDRHRPLTDFVPETFRDDLRRNRDAIEKAAGFVPVGFRAPVFSLTPATAWAHTILAEEGFIYSSSVLAAPNPLYGWPEFGIRPRRMGSLWELPISLGSVCGAGTMPLFGGTYFRCLPWMLTRRKALGEIKEGRAVLSYFHPYDIDWHQTRCLHQGVAAKPWLNFLLFARRRSLPRRIGQLMDLFGEVRSYSDYCSSQSTNR